MSRVSVYMAQRIALVLGLFIFMSMVACAEEGGQSFAHEWADKEFGTYPWNDEPARTAYETALQELTEGLCAELREIREAIAPPEHAYQVLLECIALRDAWFASDHLENFMLSGWLTEAVSTALTSWIENTHEPASGLQLDISARIELDLEQPLHRLDALLSARGFSHKQWSAYPEGKIARQNKDWVDYLQHFALGYVEEELDTEDGLTYTRVVLLPTLKNAESTPFVAMTFNMLLDPFNAMRMGEVAYCVGYWVALSDELRKLELRRQALEMRRSRPSEFRTWKQALAVLLPEVGEAGTRWLLADYVAGLDVQHQIIARNPKLSGSSLTSCMTSNHEGEMMGFPISRRDALLDKLEKYVPAYPVE